MLPATGPDSVTWLADGVRHQILLRVLPAQRHEVLGPLSATRLGLALLGRRLQAQPPQLDGAAQRLAELSGQVADAVAALAQLRLWDGASRPLLPLAGVLQGCAALLRTGASLRGLQIDLDGMADAAAGLPALPAPDAHYAVLGWLLHHLDRAPAPARLVLDTGQGCLLLRSLPLAQQAQGEPLHAPAPGRPLAADALGWLLADTGWHRPPAPPGCDALAWPAG